MAIVNLSNTVNQDDTGYLNLFEAYSEIMGIGEVRDSDSFLSFGGDSLSFIIVSMAVEKYIGFLPSNWEAMTIKELELLKTNQFKSQPDSASVKKSWVIIGLIISFFILGEVLLQTRNYYKTGRSAYTLLTAGSTQIFNEDMGTNTYRPSVTFSPYEGVVYSTNSQGLRYADIPIQKNTNELRIAIVGASTVAGIFAETNEHTLSAVLERKLRNEASENYEVNVINGGIDGNTIVGIKEVTENIIFKMQPDIIIIYPGLNDLSMICSAAKKKTAEYKSFDYYPKIPSWILSKELIKKNTSFIREQKVKNVNMFDPNDLDTSAYRQSLDDLVNNIKKQDIIPVLATVARAYNNLDATIEEKTDIAVSALYYSPCLDIHSLIEIGDKYNSDMESVGAKYQAPVIDLARQMPGGDDYFIDGGHFSFEGEEKAATIILEQLKFLGLVN